MSAWIEMVSDADADAELLEVLQLARTPHGTVDNVMRVHSLRPNTMRGHVILYRAALHDGANTIPTWFQETISSYVSMLNDCDYSLANHWANARHLIGPCLLRRLQKRPPPSQPAPGPKRLLRSPHLRKSRQTPRPVLTHKLDRTRRNNKRIDIHSIKQNIKRKRRFSSALAFSFTRIKVPGTFFGQILNHILTQSEMF